MKKHGNNFQDLTGKIFSRLTVIEFSHSVGNNKNTTLYWKCLCSCGNIKIVAGSNLKSKRSPTKSCGCLNRYNTIKRNTKHGLYYSVERNTWQKIKDRCLNPNQPAYPNYGGRGISICERWLDKERGFLNFLEDVGNRPSPRYSLDRIDNNGNYEPSNIRWATREEQNGNTRRNVWYEYNGERLLLSDWARKFNMFHGNLSRFIRNHGNSFEKAYLYYTAKLNK